MSVTSGAVRILGAILAFVGFCLILAAVGANLIGVHIPAAWYVEIIVGLLLFAFGAYIAAGGTITA